MLSIDRLEHLDVAVVRDHTRALRVHLSDPRNGLVLVSLDPVAAAEIGGRIVGAGLRAIQWSATDPAAGGE